MKQSVAKFFVAVSLIAAAGCVDQVDSNEDDIEEEFWSDGKSDFAADTTKLAELVKNNRQEPFHTYGNMGSVVSDTFRRVSMLKDANDKLLGIIVVHVRRGTSSNWETKSFTEYHIFDAELTPKGNGQDFNAKYTTYVDTKNNGVLEVSGLRREGAQLVISKDAAGNVAEIFLPKTRVPKSGPQASGSVRSSLRINQAGYAFTDDGAKRVEKIWTLDPTQATESNPANIPAPPVQAIGPGPGMPLAEAAPWAKAILAKSSIRHFATYGVAGANGEAATFRSISFIVDNTGKVRGYMDHFGRAGALDTASSTGIILLRDGESANGGGAEWLADLNNDGKLEVNGNAEQVRLWIGADTIRAQGVTMNRLGTMPPEAIRADVTIDKSKYLLDGVSGLKQPDGTVVVPEGAANGGRFFQTSLRLR